MFASKINSCFIMGTDTKMSNFKDWPIPLCLYHLQFFQTQQALSKYFVFGAGLRYSHHLMIVLALTLNSFIKLGKSTSIRRGAKSGIQQNTCSTAQNTICVWPPCWLEVYILQKWINIFEYLGKKKKNDSPTVLNEKSTFPPIPSQDQYF